MWIYSQSTGSIWNEKGFLVADGYSGFKEGKNNPDKEDVRNVGPIPKGLYVLGEAYTSNKLGALSIPLYPSCHDALQRTYFRIHGDSSAHPGEASKGCIVLWRSIRVIIINSDDKILKVIE